MKSIKNHLMFILPLLTILLSVEFLVIFDRVTKQYQEELKQGYTMLVVASEPLKTAQLQKIDKSIKKLTEIDRAMILKEIGEGIGDRGRKEVLRSLPYFYNLSLKEYLSTGALEVLKTKLESHPKIERVETFGSSYASNYRLFSLVKLVLKVFVGFMSIVSLFLVIKQMEIWRFEHKERMQVMEIFGAPLMLRSGVLLKVAFFDALIASLLTAGVFYVLREQWAAQSGIEIIMRNQEKLFAWSDVAILAITAFLLVFIAVFTVIFTAKEEEV